jgi:hypothetical protein
MHMFHISHIIKEGQWKPAWGWLLEIYFSQAHKRSFETCIPLSQALDVFLTKSHSLLNHSQCATLQYLTRNSCCCYSTLNIRYGYLHDFFRCQCNKTRGRLIWTVWRCSETSQCVQHNPGLTMYTGWQHMWMLNHEQVCIYLWPPVIAFRRFPVIS